MMTVEHFPAFSNFDAARVCDRVVRARACVFVFVRGDEVGFVFSGPNKMEHS